MKYNTPHQTPEEIKIAQAKFKEMQDRMAVGLKEVEPVSFELFYEGMNALRATGYSNLRELDDEGYKVWYETLKETGSLIFSLTVQKLLSANHDSPRLLLGAMVATAEEVFQETLAALREQHIGAEHGLLRYYDATKMMGLPRTSPQQLVRKHSLQKMSAVLGYEISGETPEYNHMLGGHKDVPLAAYDPQLHGAEDLF